MIDKFEKNLIDNECLKKNSLEFQLSHFEDFFMGQHKDKFTLEAETFFEGIETSKKLKSQRSSRSDLIQLEPSAEKSESAHSEADKGGDGDETELETNYDKTASLKSKTSTQAGVKNQRNKRNKRKKQR